MRPPKPAAGAKCTAKTAELRKGTAANVSGTRRNGKELRKNCRKTAEQLQNLSVSGSALTLPTPAPLAAAPTLVQMLAPEMPRKVKPAGPLARRGNAATSEVIRFAAWPFPLIDREQIAKLPPEELARLQRVILCHLELAEILPVKKLLAERAAQAAAPPARVYEFTPRDARPDGPASE